MKREKFESGSYSEQCAQFFDATHDWDGIRGSFATRAVTWAQYPYRYWLTEFGEVQKKPLRRARIQHKLYELARLSASTTNKTQHIDIWYAIQAEGVEHEVVAKLQHTVDLNNDHEETTSAIRSDFYFMIDNDLCTANGEDMLIFQQALELGLLDGYDPMRPRNNPNS